MLQVGGGISSDLSQQCLFMKMILFLVLSLTLGTERAEAQRAVVVSSDGSGDFASIQAALDAAPTDATSPWIILIKNGTYNEKLFITKRFITLVGEHRDSTRIVHAELRENWTKAANTRPDGTGEELDWGAAVINIGKGAADVTLANLTVHNNYGTLYGSHEHQFTIRGFDATRIMLLACNVISDGGDALALWNRDSGMYYHNDCYFEGWVDYVCPRGWCYITDSKFFGHNLSASIWHDGSRDRRQKFVIRNSSFDGVPGFPLGRHHRDAQIFLLDCRFSSNMADRPIYAPKSPNTVPWKWGERHYFYNCHREGGDYAWFADNLETAEGAPKAEEVTARWTFDGMWDPEASMPSVLPFAFLPQPHNGSVRQRRESVRLSWIAGREAQSHNVYVGTENPPPFLRNQRQTEAVVSELRPRTRYYWRVDTVTNEGVVSGKVWHFETE